MNKKYVNKEDYNKIYKDENGVEWKYYSDKKMKELFSKDYKKTINITGEISFDDQYKKSTIEHNNNKLSVVSFGVNRKFFKNVSGYIECENNEYVAVIKSDWKKISIIIISIILLIIGAFFATSYLKDRGNDIDKSASDYVANVEMPDNTDPTKISIPGYNEIVAKTGEGAAYVALYNPKGNPVYFQFEVILDQSGETIFKTGLIPPGKAVKEIPLSKDMKPGKYDLTLRVNTFSLEDNKKPMNGGEIKTKLIIKD